MEFYIEYETPPLRAIFTTELRADSEEQAIEFFRLAHPGSKIRKIEGYGFSK